MSLISDLLVSMRYELQDMDGSVYSNYVLMDTYNKGNKLLRNTILDHFPMQLAEEVTGSVNVSESITMLKKPIKILDLRINNHKIDKVSIAEIPDRTATGEPKAYYLLNTSTIKLYPISDKTYPYSIIYISESVNMLDTDDSGYQTDVEQLLIRYVVDILTGKGFDLVSEYNSTIGKLLGGIETGVTVVDGYQDSYSGGGDYR